MKIQYCDSEHLLLDDKIVEAQGLWPKRWHYVQKDGTVDRKMSEALCAIYVNDNGEIEPFDICGGQFLFRTYELEVSITNETLYLQKLPFNTAGIVNAFIKSNGGDCELHYQDTEYSKSRLLCVVSPLSRYANLLGVRLPREFELHTDPHYDINEIECTIRTTGYYLPCQPQ